MGDFNCSFTNQNCKMDFVSRQRGTFVVQKNTLINLPGATKGPWLPGLRLNLGADKTFVRLICVGVLSPCIFRHSTVTSNMSDKICTQGSNCANSAFGCLELLGRRRFVKTFEIRRLCCER